MTFTTSGAAVIKAGAGVSSSVPDTNGWVTWISGAEAFINVATKKNWSDGYAALNPDVKHVLDDVTSSLVAINAVAYDMSGYTSRAEAEDIITILRDSANRGIKELKEREQQTFMDGA